MTSKSVKSNLLKGANRNHFGIEYKQGATNVDFSDGSWLLVASPEILKWKDNIISDNFNDMVVELVESHQGTDKVGNNVDHKIEFRVDNRKIVVHAYN